MKILAADCVTELASVNSSATERAAFHSWMAGVNRNVTGLTVRRVVGYNGSAVRYRKRTVAAAAGRYREFIMD